MVTQSGSPREYAASTSARAIERRFRQLSAILLIQAPRPDADHGAGLVDTAGAQLSEPDQGDALENIAVVIEPIRRYLKLPGDRGHGHRAVLKSLQDGETHWVAKPAHPTGGRRF